MAHTLLVLRHAKSDWAVPVSDRNGHSRSVVCVKRRIPAGGSPTTILCRMSSSSPRPRAQSGPGNSSAAPGPIRRRRSGSTRRPTPSARAGCSASCARRREMRRRLALVGHNPAVEELVAVLTDESVRMPTSGAGRGRPRSLAGRRYAGRLPQVCRSPRRRIGFLIWTAKCRD